MSIVPGDGPHGEYLARPPHRARARHRAVNGNPARGPGGPNLSELSDVLGAAVGSGRAAGLTVTIYNPVLDPDDGTGREFARSTAAGLSGAPGPGER